MSSYLEFLTTVNVFFTVAFVYLVIKELEKLRMEVSSLKQDHFDISVALMKLVTRLDEAAECSRGNDKPLPPPSP